MSERLFRILAELTPRDVIIGVVDILIVYYAIYRVLLLIKGTRAAQMVIGLVLIGASYFAAKTLEITTVSWLLDNFINYFIIIIIVVFQHDIRRGLVRIGQNLFAFGRTYEETHVFEEVVHASEILAKRRIGAIFVFEREADLADLVKTGAVVDARVDAKLLAALCIPSRDNVKFVVAQIAAVSEGGEYTLGELRERVRRNLAEQGGARRFLDAQRREIYVVVHTDRARRAADALVAAARP